MRDARGDYHSAVLHHAEALDMQVAVYGARAINAEVANSRENLGNALFHRGDPADLPRARLELNRALVMRESIAAGQNYPMVRTLAKLGDVLAVLGDVDDAAANYLRAKVILDSMEADDIVLHKQTKIDDALGRLARVGAGAAGPGPGGG